MAKHHVQRVMFQQRPFGHEHLESTDVWMMVPVDALGALSERSFHGGDGGSDFGLSQMSTFMLSLLKAHEDSVLKSLCMPFVRQIGST